MDVAQHARIPKLTEILSDSHRAYTVRQGAVADLLRVERRFPSTGAVEAMITFSVQPDLDLEGAGLVASIAIGLVELGRESATSALEQIAANGNERCRRACAGVLAARLKSLRRSADPLPDQEAVLRRVLDGMAASDSSPEVRRLAARPLK